MATSKLIQWLPKILRAADEDIARFGPQAARVRALLDFIPGMSRDARNAMWGVAENASFATGNLAAWRAAADAAEEAKRLAALDAATDAAWEAVKIPASWSPATKAATAEVVSDLIDPQTYRMLTEPLNVGRVYDLRVPEAGSEFMRLVGELRPRNADDIERIADLSVNPRVQGILELLQGIQGNMPLAAKIDAARRLDRASRAGRRLS